MVPLEKGLNVKGWKIGKDAIDAADLSCMDAFLYSNDLAAEFTAGGVQTVVNLQILHNGMKTPLSRLSLFYYNGF